MLSQAKHLGIEMMRFFVAALLRMTPCWTAGDLRLGTVVEAVMSDFLAFNRSAVVLSRHDAPGTAWAHLRCDSQESLASFLAEAAGAGVQIVPSPPRALPPATTLKSVVFLDTSNLCEVMDYSPEDQVISVGAGMSLSALDELVGKRHQWWPVMAADFSQTVADVIARGDGGCLEHGFGGPRDLVLGMTVALSTGDVVKCGGRVVKNVTGYDLGKLFTGSRASLGLVSSANLRLYARPECSRSLLWPSADHKAVLTAAARLLRSGLPLSCLELVDCRVLSALAVSNRDLERFLESCQAPGVATGALLVRADGHEDVALEVLAATERLSEFAAGEAQPLPAEIAEGLWRGLSDVGQATTLASLEASVSLSQLHSVFKGCWTDSSRPLWQARPGRGRLKVYGADTSSVSDILADIKSFAVASGESFFVAYGDQEFEYRAEKIPDGDPHADKLKVALKERFDPQRSLNPLVRM